MVRYSIYNHFGDSANPKHLNNSVVKPTRYRINALNSTVESGIIYAKENLLAIPPLLQPPPPVVIPQGPANLPGYVIGQPVVLPGFAIAPPGNPGVNLNFLQNLWQNIKKKSIKPAPLQKNYALDQRVRLRIPKGALAKFDRPNWSEQIYTITSVTQQTQNNLNNAAAKPTRYRITPLNGLVESDIRYAKENLLPIPPLLQPPAPIVAPQGPANLPGFIIGPPPILPGYVVAPAGVPGMNFNFLQNLWANINGGPVAPAPVAPAPAPAPVAPAPVIPGYQVNAAGN